MKALSTKLLQVLHCLHFDVDGHVRRRCQDFSRFSPGLWCDLSHLRLTGFGLAKMGLRLDLDFFKSHDHIKHQTSSINCEAKLYKKLEHNFWIGFRSLNRILMRKEAAKSQKESCEKLEKPISNLFSNKILIGKECSQKPESYKKLNMEFFTAAPLSPLVRQLSISSKHSPYQPLYVSNR